jgi:hypothetical protein
MNTTAERAPDGRRADVAPPADIDAMLAQLDAETAASPAVARGLTPADIDAMLAQLDAETAASPAPRYIIECYARRRWLIRCLKTGDIVAYPGPRLENVAQSWLEFETGQTGARVAGLAEFTARVETAVSVILHAIDRAGAVD